MESIFAADISYVIQSYLDLPSLYSLMLCSSLSHRSINRRQELWYKLLLHKLPNFKPFLNASKNDFNSKSILKNYVTKNFNWEKIGEGQNFLPRYLHRCFQDPNSNSVYVFGGEGVLNSDNNSKVLLNDVWRIDFEDKDFKKSPELRFLKLGIANSSHTPPVASASAICILRDTMYVFGGIISSTPHGNDRIFSNQFWCLRNLTSELKDSRQWRCLSHSKHASRYIQRRDDDYEAINMPAGRWGHTMLPIFDEMIVLFGGSCPGRSFHDLWIYVPKLNRWFQIVMMMSNPISQRNATISDLNLPAPRSGHAATIVNDYMYIIGGNNASVSYNDIWRISVKQLYDIVQSHIKSYDITNCEQFISDSDSELNLITIKTSSLASPLWELITSNSSIQAHYNPFPEVNNTFQSNGPSCSIGHSSTRVGDQIIIYGGRDFHRREYRADVRVYDTKKNIWSTLEVQGIKNGVDAYSPMLRTGHCAFSCKYGIIYIGGLLKNNEYSSEVFLLNLFGVSDNYHHKFTHQEYKRFKYSYYDSEIATSREEDDETSSTVSKSSSCFKKSDLTGKSRLKSSDSLRSTHSVNVHFSDLNRMTERLSLDQHKMSYPPYPQFISQSEQSTGRMSDPHHKRCFDEFDSKDDHCDVVSDSDHTDADTHLSYNISTPVSILSRQTSGTSVHNDNDSATRYDDSEYIMDDGREKFSAICSDMLRRYSTESAPPLETWYEGSSTPKPRELTIPAVAMPIFSRQSSNTSTIATMTDIHDYYDYQGTSHVSTPTSGGSRLKHFDQTLSLVELIE